MRFLAPLVTRALGQAAAWFHHIERVGPPLPDGPVLVVANHPNSLLDPLVIFRIAGRSTRPLAKAPLFEQAGVGLLLRAMNGLPVYRRQDHPDLMERNEDTFRAAIDALRSGEAVQIYPEGISHNEPQLQPLKTGAARIALAAEAETGWALGLQVVPVGLTYSREKTVYRSRAVARVGHAIPVAEWRAAYQADDQEAVRGLTAEIGRRMTAITLNLAEKEDRDLIETAERLWAAEKALAGWRERPELVERLPRLGAFARGLGWLREHDPARHQRLSRAVLRHQRRLAVIGAAEGEAPPRYTAAAVVRYVIERVLLLLLTFPAGVAGMILWAPPYRLTWLAVRRVKPPSEDTIATYKLGAALLAYPLAWAGWVAVAWWAWGVTGAVAAALILWPLGGLGIYWKRRFQRVVEDVRLFLRLVTHPDWRAQIAADRRRLVVEFDEIWEEAERESRV